MEELLLPTQDTIDLWNSLPQRYGDCLQPPACHCLLQFFLKICVKSFAQPFSAPLSLNSSTGL